MGESRLDVSRGRVVEFAAGGANFHGVIVSSRRSSSDPMHAEITVRSDRPVPGGAQLSIPLVPETGGCGLAPSENDGHTVILSVGYSHVDASTIGQ